MKKGREQPDFFNEDERLAPAPETPEYAEADERERLWLTYGEDAGLAPLSSKERNQEREIIKKMIARTKEMLARKAREPFPK